MTRKLKRASFSLATACGLALLTGTAASAADKDVTVVGEAAPADILSERVSYADLDLASSAGIERLGLRVRGAVKSVCEPHDERHSFGDYGACRSYALDGAEPQMELAIARAGQLVATGTTTIAPVAIVIAAPAR